MARQLGYACWTPVLQNLDANARIQIGLQCPLLQTLDRKLPIKTKSMKIGLNSIQLDDVKIEQSMVALQEPESEARKAVYAKLKSAEEELSKQQRNLKDARDKNSVRTSIEKLRKSISFLKQRHTDLKPKRMEYHQLVSSRGSQKTILGSAQVRNKSKTDAYIYLVDKIFRRNTSIDTITVTGYYDVMPKFELSLLKNARSLQFDCTMNNEILLGLANSSVYFARNCIRSTNLTEDLVADWQKKHRPTGTRFVFPCSKYQAQNMMNYVESVAGARRVETTDKRAMLQYAITFPMSEDAEITVVCLKSSEIVMDVNYVQFHFVIQPKASLAVV